MAPSLRLHQSQRLALTPGVRVGLNVLAMPLAELSALLSEEAERNPILVVDHVPRPDRPATSDGALDALGNTVAARETQIGRAHV